MTREKKRRQYRTGSVYQRSADGLWLATIEHGYTRTGGRRRVAVTGKTEAEAKRKLAQKVRAITRDEAAQTRTTVKAWSVEWLKMTAHEVRPKTRSTDKGAVGWIVATIGHKRLDQLTPGDVRALREAVTGAGLSTSTALRYHGVLMRMLKAAIDDGYPVPARVVAPKKGPTAAVNDRQAMPLADALAVLSVAATLDHGSRWVAALLQGMRQGECLGLTWDNVGADSLTICWQLQALQYRDPHDKARGFIIPDGYEVRHLERALHLVRPKSKAGWRKIPLVPFMADALDHWRSISPVEDLLVWPRTDGGPASATQDRREWEALQDTVGVRHPSGRFYTLHEARHTTATLLLEMGVPESVRIAIMGHSSIASTHSYEHVDVTLAREALAQVAGRLQLGGQPEPVEQVADQARSI